MSKSSWSSTTRLTSPASNASTAEIGSPSRFISSAFAGPTSRGSRWVPPKPGMIPRLISGWPKEAESAGDPEVARHRDLAAAAEGEPVDRGDRHHRRALPLAPQRPGSPRGARGPTSASHCVNALMSAPAQNSAGFAEASTIARAPRRHQRAPGLAQPRDRRRARASSPAGCRARRPRRRRAAPASPGPSTARPAGTDRSPARTPRPAAPARPAAAGSPAARGARSSPRRASSAASTASSPRASAAANGPGLTPAPSISAMSMSRTPAMPSSSTRHASTNRRSSAIALDGEPLAVRLRQIRSRSAQQRSTTKPGHSPTRTGVLRIACAKFARDLQRLGGGVVALDDLDQPRARRRSASRRPGAGAA